MTSKFDLTSSRLPLDRAWSRTPTPRCSRQARLRPRPRRRPRRLDIRRSRPLPRHPPQCSDAVTRGRQTVKVAEQRVLPERRLHIPLDLRPPADRTLRLSGTRTEPVQRHPVRTSSPSSAVRLPVGGPTLDHARRLGSPDEAADPFDPNDMTACRRDRLEHPLGERKHVDGGRARKKRSRTKKMAQHVEEDAPVGVPEYGDLRRCQRQSDNLTWTHDLENPASGQRGRGHHRATALARTLGDRGRGLLAEGARLRRACLRRGTRDVRLRSTTRLGAEQRGLVDTRNSARRQLKAG